MSKVDLFGFLSLFTSQKMKKKSISGGSNYILLSSENTVRKALHWNLHLANYLLCKSNQIYFNKINDPHLSALIHSTPQPSTCSPYSPPTFKTPGKQINPRNGRDKKDSQRGSQEFPSPSADSQHSLRSADSQPSAVPMSEANSPQPPTYYSLRRKGKIKIF